MQLQRHEKASQHGHNGCSKILMHTYSLKVKKCKRCESLSLIGFYQSKANSNPKNLSKPRHNAEQERNKLSPIKHMTIRAFRKKRYETRYDSSASDSLKKINFVGLHKSVRPHNRAGPTNKPVLKLQTTVVQKLFIAFVPQQEKQNHLPHDKAANKPQYAHEINHAKHFASCRKKIKLGLRP